jgi:hypothetical protein
MRLLLALLLLAPSLVWGQAPLVVACDGPWGGAEGCGGCNGLRLTTPQVSTWVQNNVPRSGSSAWWDQWGTLPDTGVIRVVDGATAGPIASCPANSRTMTKAAYLAGGTPTPEPPPTPVWTGDMVLAWSAPSVNTNGTPIVPPLSYRVTINGVAVSTVSTLSYTASGLPAGQHCATVATISAGGTGPESLAACTTLAPPATNVCTTPQPAAETQTVACPAGTTGSWTQTRTYSAAAFPACWTASAWTPTSAPAGSCVAIPPPPVAVVAPVVAGQNMAPVFGITGTNTRGTTVLGFVPVGRACTGPVVYTYRGQGYRRFTSADALWWQSTPTTAAAVACQ